MGPLLKTIGWGLYCTCSWTWCIGMWLPLLLIERWGWPGFWLFAIPNVLGCAAMGYIVRSAATSAALVQQHRGAMRWFSCVTIAFQLYWITAIACTLGFDAFIPSSAAMVLVPTVVLGLALLVACLPLAGWLIAATALFAWTMTSFGLVGTQFMAQIPDRGSVPPVELWGAAPIIVIGFLLSPYLDLTFHRARRETPSRHAFAVFGITFMAVLLFVTSYWTVGSWTDGVLGIVLLFWLLQVIFTIGAHLRELAATNAPGSGRWGPAHVLVVLAAIPVPLVWIAHRLGASQSSLLDDTYLRFLGFYGLAVPIWVLAFMWPGQAERSRRIGIVLIGVLTATFVLAELGMVGSPTWWLLPAAGLAIAVPIVLGRNSPDAITR